MADRDPVLTAWQAAGTDLTMLPSGMEVRLEQVPVAEMVRSGFLPSQLRVVAMRFASTEGLKPDELNEGELADWAALTRQMISRWVAAVRWVCSCPECSTRRTEPIEERPYHLDPESLSTDPPPIPRVDLAALEDLVMYLRTPRQVDALSRVAHGQMEIDAASAVVEAERVNTLSGWASFRPGGTSLDAAAHGDDLRRAAVGLPRANRAARRAAARRGARAAGRPGTAGSTKPTPGP